MSGRSNYRARREPVATRDGSGEIALSPRHPGVLPRLHPHPASTEGKLYTCLFATAATPARALRARPDSEIRDTVAAVCAKRPDLYSEIERQTAKLEKIEMSYIGG